MIERIGNAASSEAGHGSRVWRFHVEDMLACAERVRDYTAGLDHETFVVDSLTYDATLRNLCLISGAAVHVPEVLRETCPDIPWRSIIGLHERLLGGYPDIDNGVVWSIIEDVVPALLPALRDLLTEAGKDT